MACASPTQATQPMTTQTTAAPKFGTMIPSRIFVGGIDFKVCMQHSPVQHMTIKMFC